MPKLYNKHHGDAPADAVYIGRGSPWGNMYTHLDVEDHPDFETPTKVATREEAVEKYREHVMKSPRFRELIKENLKGKDLLCFCTPKKCHGEVLIWIANEEE